MTVGVEYFCHTCEFNVTPRKGSARMGDQGKWMVCPFCECLVLPSVVTHRTPTGSEGSA